MYKKDLLYTAINQLWRIIAGPLVLLFIPLYLTPVEQGYWYTFTSIAALAVFADLGFSTIILQFAAHEFAYLKFNNDMTLSGDAEHLWRLASFFRFSLQWLLRIICLVFPLIVFGGYLFLQSKGENIVWQLPWLIYAATSGLVFLYSSLLCFFEGCSLVGNVQSVRFRIAVLTSMTMLAGLYFHLSLYALSLSIVVSAVAGFFLVLKKFLCPMCQLWNLSREKVYPWWPEFSTLIWRYAISWCSGYFIFQLFTPLAFKFHGSVFAGMVGISIAMWTAGFNVSMTWLTAVNPRLNILVAERDWSGLDRLFWKSLLRSMGTMLFGGSAFFLIYFSLFGQVDFFHRFLGAKSMLILFFCWLCQLYVNDVALYLRAHKREPLMILSVLSAVYVAVTTYLCAEYLSEEWLFLGFLTSYLWGIPVVIKILNDQKREHVEL